MKVVITEHKPQGGTTTLFSVDREDGSQLIDNTGSLSQVYYGYSEEEAIVFHDNEVANKTVQWYKS